MNEADSDKLASALDQLGLTKKDNAEDADLVVLNSCVVRQSAEDKVSYRVSISQEFKKDRPEQMLVLMGCMVGPNSENLQKRFPSVDMFMRPQDFNPLLEQIAELNDVDLEGCISNYAHSNPGISCHVPIIKGCDFMCSFCIIPYRRGRQESRTIRDIVSEVSILVDRGVKEITLLGQTVDAYGHDLNEDVDLADLLGHVNDITGLERIRFLTSHPSFMSEKIIESDIVHEMSDSYMEYAMSVIVGRALPDVSDGLKPVHRRVLFSMGEQGNDFNKPYRKSARVVGDVIGKYHPHGDAAVYDTIVRLTQNFSMRYQLIDRQGNF